MVNSSEITSWHFGKRAGKEQAFVSVNWKWPKNTSSMYQGLHKGMSISWSYLMRREYKKMIFMELLSVQTIQHHCCKDVPACNWSILSRENFSGRYLWCQKYSGYPSSPWAYNKKAKKKTRSNIRVLLGL